MSAVVGAALLAVVMIFAPARADVFVVNSTGATDDVAAGDGVCADINLECTWRAAVSESNRLPGQDTIWLPAGVYAGWIADLQDDVEIIGEGAGATVLDGDGTRQILEVSKGASVRIAGVTFQKALSTTGGGGAISAYLGSTVRLTDCEFLDNESGGGAAIWTWADVIVERCSFVGNRAVAGAAILAARGVDVMVIASTFASNVGDSNASAIHNQDESTLSIVNSTFSGNRGGWAIVNGGDADATIVNSTIAHNEGGVVVYAGSTVSFANTIVAKNDPEPLLDDCVVLGAVVTNGGNLSSDGSCGFADPTDVGSVDPGLGPLADNGGPTLTHALQPGSVALGAGVAAECPETDQRGADRSSATACDSGAYEVSGVVPTSTTTTFATTSTTTTISSSSTTSTTTSTTTSSSSSSVSTTSSTSTTATTTTTSSTTSSTEPPACEEADCDDGDPCTVDSCDLPDGCRHDLLASYAGLRCLVGSLGDPALCDEPLSGKLAAFIDKRIGKALEAAERAETSVRDRARRRRLRKLERQLRKVARRVARFVRRDALSGPCEDAINVRLCQAVSGVVPDLVRVPCPY